MRIDRHSLSVVVRAAQGRLRAPVSGRGPDIASTGRPRHTEVVRLLVEAGADVNLADSAGVTPLALARQRGYREMIEILQKAGAPFSSLLGRLAPRRCERINRQ